eukprot:Skav231997  [mRNA]  locus=scaffold719:439782:442514:+ [translate_table: standard]
MDELQHQSRPAVVSLRETVDINKLRDYMLQGVDRRQKLLEAYVRRHDEQGVLQDDFSTLHMNYYLAPGYGRLLARGPAGQKLTREARAIAFHHASEVDAACCHPRLLRRHLIELSLWNKDDFEMLDLFCDHYKQWRQVLSSYHSIDLSSAKTELIRIFYGGKPSCDLPWLRKLGHEVQVAAQRILSHPSSEPWLQLYSGRSNPEFSRLSAILSFQEASLLDQLRGHDGVTMEVALFDGGYFQAQNLQDDLCLLEACQHVSATVVPVDVKYCPSYLQGFNRRLVRQEVVSIHKLDDVPLQYGNCLLNSIAFIDPACDCRELRDQVRARPDHGLTADDFNRMSINACNQDTLPICLQVVDLEHVLPNLQCPVLCHEADGDAGHWWVFVPADDDLIRIYDCLAPAFIVQTSRASFASATSTFAGLTFFELKSLDSMQCVAPEGDKYHLRGHACLPEHNKVTCPLTKCAVCSAPLMNAEEVHAQVYTLEGVLNVTHVRKRCTRRTCYLRHSYNYVQTGECKANILDPEDAEYIFITTQTGFSKKFLEYHDALQFRGYISMKAIEWAQRNCIWSSDEEQQARWVKSYASARLLLVCLKEFSAMWSNLSPAEKLKKLRGIDIENPLSAASLADYIDWWPTAVMPTRQRNKVTVLCMDGHEKIATQCGDSPPCRGGRPRSNGKVRPFNNGWFMVTSPESNLILAIVEMKEPENNDIALTAVMDLLHHYPNVNAVVYDRACSILSAATKETRLKPIRYWAVDKFHAKGHVGKCPCHPEKILRLKRRLKSVNTSMSEQTFSWFRGYANTFNNMAPQTQRFYVLAYGRRHNIMVSNNDVEHLNQYAAAKKTSQRCKILKRPGSKAYKCAPKRSATSSASTSSFKRPSASSSSLKRPSSSISSASKRSKTSSSSLKRPSAL